jgi:hypothetical protein
MLKVFTLLVFGHLWAGNGHLLYIIDPKNIEKCLQDIQHY